jgi:hypothetical protein
MRTEKECARRNTDPENVLPFNRVSMKNCVSKMSGVESKGAPDIGGTTNWFEAIECLDKKYRYPSCFKGASTAYDASRAITSAALNSTSLKRSRIVVTLSAGLVSEDHIRLHMSSTVDWPTKRFRNCPICSSANGRGTAKQELEPWCTGTVTHTDGSCKLNARKCVQSEVRLLYSN